MIDGPMVAPTVKDFARMLIQNFAHDAPFIVEVSGRGIRDMMVKKDSSGACILEVVTDD